jgi:glutamate--cysteine ligase
VSPIPRRELRAVIEQLFTPARNTHSGPGMVGAELELIPQRRTPDGTLELLPLATLVEWFESQAPGSEFRPVPGDRPAFDVGSGGSLTFEPGGQIEYSGPPRPTVREAGADLRRVLGSLRRALGATGIELDDAGISAPGVVGSIDLQQPNLRYEAMDSYLSRIGPWGQWMMRRTASMQVNLDLGAPERIPDRWRAANLLVPVLGGAFANSPLLLPDGTRAASGRLWIWSRIDPSRTGFVLSPPGSDPVDAYLEFALGAAVMLRGSGPGVQQGDGRSFSEWIDEPRDREPGIEDWITHLTTLFPHVRPRTWVELRFIDTPREEWWDVPLVILSAVMYDDDARTAVTDLLSPTEPRLDALTELAALTGVSDPELGELAESVFRIALDAAERMPEDYFGAAQVSAAAEFLSRFTSRCRSQADEAVRAEG